MLETFYNSFGFFGAIAIAFICFALFIFWIAGLAGIINLSESNNKNKHLLITAIFPPYPLFWLMFDIYQERKLMREKD